MAQYSVEPIHDWVIWDEFVGNSRQGTVFSTSGYLLAAQEATHDSAEILGCFCDGRLIAGTAFLSQKHHGSRRAVLPAFTPHGGILFGASDSRKTAKLEAAEHRAMVPLLAALENRYEYIRFAHSPEYEDVRQFIWRQWLTEVRYTYWLNLSDLDKLWKAFEQRTRTAIRKAERAGVIVRREEALNDFLRLYDRLSHGAWTNKDVLRKFYVALRERNLCDIYVARAADGVPVLCTAVVYGDETMYAWVAGADSDAKGTEAASLLYWTIMQEGSTRFRIFDFVGANIPSIAMFKRGFGGELVPYYSVEWKSRSGRTFATRIRRKVARLLGRGK